LGYTETKLVGSQPGEVTGSKLDLTRDDEVDIREFNLLKPVIKWIAQWCLENGFLEGLEAETLEMVESGQFDIKCHTEWEIIENQMREAELAAEETEDMAEQQATENAEVIRINDEIEQGVINALRNNVDFPTTPVSSTWISHVAVRGRDLFMKIPGWKAGPWAGYRFSDSDIAGVKGRQMLSSDSRGGWVWDNIWAPGVKPFSKGPRATRPGINDDILGIRYINDPHGGEASIGETETFEERKEGLLRPGPGLIGTDYTRRGLTLTQTPTQSTHYAPIQTTTGQTPGQGINYTSMQTPSKKAKTTQNPKGAGRKKKPGRKKGSATGTTDVVGTQSVSYVPPQYYNSATQLTFSRANAIMEEARGKGFSKTTWQELKRFIELAEKSMLFRTNSIDIGNPMSFDVKLRYLQNGTVSEEYACKREWRKVKNHKGNLYLYEDLEHGGNKHIVGNYKYYWDKDKDMPMIKRDIDEQKIQDLHREWGISESPILDKLKLNIPVSMSTEYFCGTMVHKGKKYQVNINNGKGEPILKGIAIVKQGNCDSPFCTFTPEEVIS
jgi:hypothetical protein